MRNKNIYKFSVLGVSELFEDNNIIYLSKLSFVIIQQRLSVFNFSSIFNLKILFNLIKFYFFASKKI